MRNLTGAILLFAYSVIVANLFLAFTAGQVGGLWDMIAAAVTGATQ